MPDTLTDYGNFVHHKMPSGDEVWYRDSDHAYYGEVKQRGDKWTGVRDSYLPSPSTLAKLWALDMYPRILRKIERVGMSWFEETNRKAERGTAVHEKVLECLAKGEEIPNLADLEDDERGHAQGVLRFWQAFNPKPVATEQVVFSKTHAYAGKVDLIAADADTGKVLLDLKTGFIGESAHAQLAAYRIASDECGYGPIDEAYILDVNEKGQYRLLPGLCSDEEFLAGLDLYRRAKALAKETKAQLKEVDYA